MAKYEALRHLYSLKQQAKVSLGTWRIPHFLSLDRMKVAKKDQGLPETLPTGRPPGVCLARATHFASKNIFVLEH